MQTSACLDLAVVAAELYVEVLVMIRRKFQVHPSQKEVYQQEEPYKINLYLKSVSYKRM